MPVLIQIIIAAVFVSSLSLVGVLILILGQVKLYRLNLILVAAAAGTMMGGAFFHLMPEATELLTTRQAGLWLVFGFLLFFGLEKLLHWHHCRFDSHRSSQDHLDHVLDHHRAGKAAVFCEPTKVGSQQTTKQSLGYLNLLADFFHNFIDGVVIAAAFMVNPAVGISTTVAVALHEIPQELGDFGVLLHAGFKPERALLYNFLTAWSAFLGALLGYFVLKDTSLTAYLLPFTAGGFVYISASDLIPEIKHQPDLKAALSLMLVFILGLSMMWFLV